MLEQRATIHTPISTATANQIMKMDSSGKEQIKVAVKIVDKRKIARDEERKVQLFNEIRVHWALEQCDGALRLLELFEEEHNLYMILEYQKQGTLFQQVITKKQTTEIEAKLVMEQLLLAVDFIH